MPCIFLHFINIMLGTAQMLAFYTNALNGNQFLVDLVNGQLVFTTSTIISFLIELSMIM
jgi:hypothetical protein